MATITDTGAVTASTSNVSTYASASFAPAVGDLLVVLVVASTTADAGDVTVSANGVTSMTRVDRATFDTTTHSAYIFVANQLTTGTASMTVTFDCTGDAATGAVVMVARVAGMTKTGATAIRQSIKVDTGTGGTTPVFTFPSSCLTGNPTLVVLGQISTAGSVQPSGWTEAVDTSYSTPAIGGTYVFRNSGFTGTTITWGDTETAHGGIAVELDASSNGTNLAPTALASEELHGSPTLTTVVGTEPTAIATGEAIGTTVVSTTISVTAAAIASSEAVGSPTLTHVANVSPTSIATGESAGSPVVSTVVTASPAAIATGEAVGSPVVSSVVTSSPTAIASAQAAGSPTISVTIPSISVSPTAISTGEAVGSPTVSTVVTTSPTAIVTSQAFGSPVVSPVITSSPTAISTGQAVGSPVLSTSISSSPSAIASGQAFGTPAIASVVTASPAAIATGNTFGTTIVTSLVSLSPTGIATGVAFGTVTVGAGLTLAPTSISSSEALGSPTLATLLSVTAQGIPSNELFGAVVLHYISHVVAQGFADPSTFGSLTVSTAITSVPGGIAGLAVIGTPNLTTAVVVTPSGIITLEAFGTSNLTTRVSTTADGILSQAAVGSPWINGAREFVGWGVPIGLAEIPSRNIFPVGILSVWAIGSPTITKKIALAPTGIATQVAFGTVAIGQAAPAGATNVTAFSVPSGQAFGNPNIIDRANEASLPTGIPFSLDYVEPTEASLPANVPFDLVTTEVQLITPDGVPSAQAVGIPVVASPPPGPGSQLITPAGIGSLQVFGSPTITKLSAPGDEPLFLGHKPGKVYFGWSTSHSDSAADDQLDDQTPLLGSDPVYSDLLGVRRLYSKNSTSINYADANNRVLWISAKGNELGASAGVTGWSQIASGSRDANIISYFNSIVSRNKLTVFTFHHEPIGDVSNHNTEPQIFCAANLRIMQVVDANFPGHRIIFCPNYEENRLRNTLGGSIDWALWLPESMLPGKGGARPWDFISFDIYQYGPEDMSNDPRAGVQFSHRWWRVDELFTGEFRPNGTSVMPYMDFTPGEDIVFGIGECSGRPGAFYWHENGGGAETSDMTGTKYSRDMLNYIFDSANRNKFWAVSWFNSIGADLTYNDERLYPSTITWGGKTPNHPSFVTQTGDTEITLNVYREKLRSGNTVKLASNGLPPA